MSDLDEIARAARQSTAKPPARRRSFGVVPIIVAVGVVAGLAGYMLGRSHAPAASPDFLSRIRGDVGADEAGFKVVSGPIGWTIENLDGATLTVNGVRANGEADAMIRAPRQADWQVQLNGARPMPAPTFPATVKIGEQLPVYLDGYARDVVFLDIATNHGTFRYRDGILRKQ